MAASHKRFIGGVLAFIAIILYASGYSICEYFYPEMDDIKKWRALRDLLTGIDIFTLVLLNFLPRTRLTVSVMVSFGFLCFGNIMDRTVFGIKNFVYSDYLLIIVAIAAGIYIYVKRRDLE